MVRADRWTYGGVGSRCPGKTGSAGKAGVAMGRGSHPGRYAAACANTSAQISVAATYVGFERGERRADLPAAGARAGRCGAEILVGDAPAMERIAGGQDTVGRGAAVSWQNALLSAAARTGRAAADRRMELHARRRRPNRAPAAGRPVDAQLRADVGPAGTRRAGRRRLRTG